MPLQTVHLLYGAKGLAPLPSHVSQFSFLTNLTSLLQPRADSLKLIVTSICTSRPLITPPFAFFAEDCDDELAAVSDMSKNCSNSFSISSKLLVSSGFYPDFLKAEKAKPNGLKPNPCPCWSAFCWSLLDIPVAS